ncbi:MAG TPA: exodeoxyribonuclease VII large subunit, partial [Candidatus Dormibacteraeota bacterium]
KGEVSGLKAMASGHYSFAVVDRAAKIQAFLFAGDARRLPHLPEDGQTFVFRGRVDFWDRGGQLRLIVDWIEFDDVGRLRAQLEQLKQKLELEGAFAPGRKRRIPFLPAKVALITSPTGAVIHDLQETIWERFPDMEIVVYPALVQGTASPGSVVMALRRCNRDGDADVVVIARGGGSFEELYAFNTEPVARAILASAIPVVTALGHTSDRTVADMVADAECRTPTEAGARVVPRRADLVADLAERRRRLERELGNRLDQEAERLGTRAARLRQALPNLLRRRQDRLERCRAELARLSPLLQVEGRQGQLVQIGERVELAAGRILKNARDALAHREQRLAALSPERVLTRGYAIAIDEESGHVLRSPSQTAPGRRLDVRLGEGALKARVEEAR